jgi:hypothetical protein
VLDEQLGVLLEANSDTQFGQDLTTVTTRAARTSAQGRSSGRRS